MENSNERMFIVEEVIHSWGRRIRGFRKLKGMTQIELAEAIHISPSVLSKIERGHMFPAIHLLEKIASVLNIDVAEIKLHQMNE